jgi:hypothetical protein
VVAPPLRENTQSIATITSEALINIGRFIRSARRASSGHERVVRIAGVHETSVAGLAQITIQLDLGRRSLTVPPPSRPPCRSRWEARRFGAGA